MKPTLKTTSSKCYFVNSSDLEEFAKQAYSVNAYNFALIQRTRNDLKYNLEQCLIEFNPTGTIEAREELEARLIREGHIYDNRLLFECLVKDKFLSPGKYLVKIGKIN